MEPAYICIKMGKCTTNKHNAETDTNFTRETTKIIVPETDLPSRLSFTSKMLKTNWYCFYYNSYCIRVLFFKSAPYQLTSMNMVKYSQPLSF